MSPPERMIQRDWVSERSLRLRTLRRGEGLNWVANVGVELDVYEASWRERGCKSS